MQIQHTDPHGRVCPKCDSRMMEVTDFSKEGAERFRFDCSHRLCDYREVRMPKCDEDYDPEPCSLPLPPVHRDVRITAEQIKTLKQLQEALNRGYTNGACIQFWPSYEEDEMNQHTTTGTWVCPEGERVVEVIHTEDKTIIHTKPKAAVESGFVTNVAPDQPNNVVLPIPMDGDDE